DTGAAIHACGGRVCPRVYTPADTKTLPLEESMKKSLPRAVILAVLLLAITISPALAQPATPPSAAEARKFLDDAQKRLIDLYIEAQRAAWVQSTFITFDTETLAAKRNEALLTVGVELAKQATRFDGVELPEDLHRQLVLLTRGLVLPAPSNPEKTAELTRLAASLEADYGA